MSPRPAETFRHQRASEHGSIPGTNAVINGVEDPRLPAPNAFAKGGRFNSGLALVGEEGPELVEFGGPGQVHTASETGGMLSGGSSGSVSFLINMGGIHIQGVNDPEHIADQVAPILGRRLKREIDGIQADIGWSIA